MHRRVDFAPPARQPYPAAVSTTNSDGTCPLDGPRAKLARAHEHLVALRAAIDEYLAARPFATPNERDEASGDYVFRLVVQQPLPLRLGVMVGDFAHNARSALDHLVYLLSEGAYPRTSQFPIALTANQFTE